MPGALPAPIASHANEKSIRVSPLQVRPHHRHSLRDGVNRLLRALPGETGLVVTVTSGIVSAGLTPATRASGPHAFAVRNSADR
jgi:hypothetical protein